MIKFTQLCSDHGDLYALGEDGCIYVIERFSKTEDLGGWVKKDGNYVGHNHWVDRGYSEAIKLYPNQDIPHKVVENGLPDYADPKAYDYKTIKEIRKIPDDGVPF